MEILQENLEALYKLENFRYGKSKDMKIFCNLLTTKAEDVIERKGIFRDKGIRMN